jgi:hypothetical protein
MDVTLSISSGSIGVSEATVVNATASLPSAITATPSRSTIKVEVTHSVNSLR